MSVPVTFIHYFPFRDVAARLPLPPLLPLPPPRAYRQKQMRRAARRHGIHPANPKRRR